MLKAAIQIMIVEDNLLTAQALKERVEDSPEFQVCSVHHTFSSAINAIKEKLPEVLLVDLNLPDGNGVDIIKQVSTRNLEIPILVISLFGDERHVIEAIEAGAQGYLLKESDPLQIAQSIKQILAGGSPISPSIARHLIKRFHQSDQNLSVEENILPKQELLSERELEVLQLASKGFTYSETASFLNISVNTVGSYTKRIYGKLAVNSKSEAVFEATKLGIM
jgi:DNA-binding NarL/FixJ family response regulator